MVDKELPRGFREVHVDDWQIEGRALFGAEYRKWRFVCPVCGHVASVQDYLDAGAPLGTIGFSCIGRFLDQPIGEAFALDKRTRNVKSPCNYAGGGLFRLNPVKLFSSMGSAYMFEFDREPAKEPTA